MEVEVFEGFDWSCCYGMCVDCRWEEEWVSLRIFGRSELMISYIGVLHWFFSA